MTKMRTFISALAIMVAGTAYAAGTATAPAQGQDEARNQGEQQEKVDPAIGEKGPDCLELHRIDRTEILDDYTILFHMKGKTTYVSKLPYRCHGLKFERGYSYSTSISKICGNTDFITVLRRGNSCALGPFHVYDMEKAKQQKEADKKAKNPS